MIGYVCSLYKFLDFLKIILGFPLMCVYGLPACMFAYCMNTVPMEAQRGIRSPGTVFANGCVLQELLIGSQLLSPEIITQNLYYLNHYLAH